MTTNNYLPKTHKQLNPLLWNGMTLDSTVRNTLLKIADHFYKFLEINAKPIDIVIAGSQTNYNYTEYSDIDLHLIFDFDSIKCDEPIKELFDAKRKLWKLQHNIDIYGIDVEPYAEDIKRPAVSACFSLIKNQWIKKPILKKVHYDLKNVNDKVQKWSQLIDFLVQQKNLNLAKTVKKLLFDYRKLGLKIDGEFSIPNLVFKRLRDSKKLQELINLVNNLEDHYLSLD